MLHINIHTVSMTVKTMFYPKYSISNVWINSVDPGQTAEEQSNLVYTVCSVQQNIMMG